MMKFLFLKVQASERIRFTLSSPFSSLPSSVEGSRIINSGISIVSTSGSVISATTRMFRPFSSIRTTT